MTARQTLNTEKLKKSNFILSGNPEKAMQEMMGVIDDLRSIYIEETDALLAIDTMKFLQLQEKKIEMARTYQSGVEQIKQRRDEFKSTLPAVRDELRKKQDEFSMLAGSNLDALDRMTKSVRRLGDRIMSAAREKAEKSTPNYGSSGSMSKNKRAVSIGINESA